MLKTLDMAAETLWLTLRRCAALLLTLIAPLYGMSVRACAVASRAKIFKSPLAKEMADLLSSPTMRHLREISADAAKTLVRTLDSSKLARRLLFIIVALTLLRTCLWEESGPRRGNWKTYGVCVASYYHQGFLGKPTASGDIFSPDELTAAHKSLPFGTWLKLRNIANGRQVVVRINDRGPFVAGRDLDLSKAAARALGMVDDGLARVEVTLLHK